MKNLVQPLLLFLLLAGGPLHHARAQGPTLDPAFALTSAVGNTLSTSPQIDDMVLQPDGKLLLVGDFISINNTAAVNICRLLPNGQVDPAFTAPVPDARVTCLALQADGKLLVGGRFTSVGGQPRNGLARLLPDGTLDLGFNSPFDPVPTFSSRVRQIVIQPGFGILVRGTMVPNPSTIPGFIYLARLTEATGALDATFQPSFSPRLATDVLVRPNGRLVFAGGPFLVSGLPCSVWGALPNGALDPAFTPLLGTDGAYGLVPDPATGNIYVANGTPGAALGATPVRLLPNGGPDPSFNAAMAFVTASFAGSISSLAVQPNGRLLVGGYFPLISNPNLPSDFAGSWRLLPSGARDPSYQLANGPGAGVSKVLVQSNGRLVFGGFFDTAGGFSLQCLARMLDPNVLSARAPGPADENALTAWPVPAHDALHLRLPAGRPARQAQLLDALGRVVLRQALAPGQTNPALPTAGLPPGGYLLCVTYASGPPAYRRVVLE